MMDNITIFTDRKEKARIFTSVFPGCECVLVPNPLKCTGIVNNELQFDLSYITVASNYFIATDIDDEGEFVCFQIIKALNDSEDSLKRVLMYDVNKVLEAFQQPTCVDLKRIQKLMERKRTDLESGAVISSFLYNNVSKSYEKKLLCNISQYYALKNALNNNVAVLGNRAEFKQLRICNDTNSLKLIRSEEYKSFYDGNEEVIYNLYLRGFITMPDLQRTIKTDTSSLTAAEKKVYMSIRRVKPWLLVDNNGTTYFESSYDGELIEPSTIVFTNKFSDDAVLQALVHRGFVKSVKGEVYKVEKLGEVICKFLQRNGIEEDWRQLLGKPNLFEIDVGSGVKCIVGKYGLVLKTVSNEFISMPADYDVDELFSGKLSFENPVGYWKGKAVFLKSGPYGLYAKVGDKNISLKTNRTNLRWDEIEKIISKYKK
jgi:hypothetical protein